MDPRRKLDEKADRLSRSSVPFISIGRETALVEQPLGAPMETEIVVVRIEKAKLKIYAFLVVSALVIMTLHAVLSD